MKVVLAKGRRARSVDAKDQRRASLVSAAHTALTTASYEEVRIETVAAAAGLAKGTAYVYFASKEAMFLAVLIRELGEWFAELEGALRRVKRDATSAVPRVIATTLGARPELMTLLARLHGQLERNSPEADIRAFKSFLRDRLARVGSRIDEALHLHPGEGGRLLVLTHALTIGLGQMANPPEVVRRVITSDPAFSVFESDFVRDLSRTLRDVLRGWAAAGNPQS